MFKCIFYHIRWKTFKGHSRAHTDNTYIKVIIRYRSAHGLQVLDLRQVWQGTSVGKCAHTSPTSRTSTPWVGYGGGDGNVGAPLHVIYSGTENTGWEKFICYKHDIQTHFKLEPKPLWIQEIGNDDAEVHWGLNTVKCCAMLAWRVLKDIKNIHYSLCTKVRVEKLCNTSLTNKIQRMRTGGRYILSDVCGVCQFTAWLGSVL